MNQMLQKHFLSQVDVEDLLKEYGSPLYVYDEKTLRERVKEMVNLLPYPWFGASCSIKANSNLFLLEILKEEGMDADAMSPGEIYLLEKAGFDGSRIFYICNNVSAEEMKYRWTEYSSVWIPFRSWRCWEGSTGRRSCSRFNPERRMPS